MRADDDCIAAPCSKRATHTLTVRVLAYNIFPEHEMENRYCLEHAVYFAGWLPYCYPSRYQIISITPPASESFRR